MRDSQCDKTFKRAVSGVWSGLNQSEKLRGLSRIERDAILIIGDDSRVCH